MVFTKQRMNSSINAKGFTLIEVLLVIAILAILASVVIVAINPAKQFSSARDAQRQSDVYSIMNALHQYALDHEGSFPDAITTDPLEVCRTGSVSCVDMYDLSDLTLNEAYLISIPVDPLCHPSNLNCADNETGYFVAQTDGGRMWVSANDAEHGTIEITR